MSLFDSLQEYCAESFRKFAQNSALLSNIEKSRRFTHCALLGIAVTLVSLRYVAPANSGIQILLPYLCCIVGLLGIGLGYVASIVCNNRCRTICLTLLPSIVIFQLWAFTLPRGFLYLDDSLPFVAYLLIGGFITFFITHSRQLSKRWFYPVSLAAALYAAFWAYTPNLLNVSYAERHHTTAVTHSFYQVAYNLPISIYNPPLYGHSAILLWPILRLFRAKLWLIIPALLAVLQFVSYLLIAYIITKLVKNQWVCVLGILAQIFWYGGNVYPANFPMRLIFPCLILAHMVYCEEHGTVLKVQALFIGYLLCSAGVVWATDAGLVAVVAYTGGLWIASWRQEQRFFNRKQAGFYILTMLASIVAVFSKIAVVNLYNYLCGGPILFKECFFPLIGNSNIKESSSFAADLFVSLTVDTYATWLLPIGLFLLFIVRGFKTAFFNPHESLAPTFVALMGLAQSYYFFNRAIAGWVCILAYYLLCLTLLADNMVNKPLRHAWKHCDFIGMLYGCARYAATILLGAYVVGTTLSAKQLVQDRINKDYYSLQTMHEAVIWLNEIVPDDAAAYGYCTQELFSAAGRGFTGWTGRDVSDVYASRNQMINNDVVSALKTMENFMQKYDHVVIHADFFDAMNEDSIYKVVSMWPQSNPMFYYCEKVKEIPGITKPI